MKTKSVLNTICGLPLLASVLALAPMAHATVTNLAYWRFGENDPGAANGGTATSTTNLVGGVLNLVGGPKYTNDVAATATAGAGSTLALRFSGANYGTNAVVSTLTNNFGLELWVRPDATNTTQALAYNGDSSANGWGLYLNAGQFKGLFGSVSLFAVTAAPATPGVWTHVALVRNNGTNILYFNGAPVFTNTANPNVPSGRFAVAVQPQTLGAEFLAGALDEVRVFSFAPGAFNTNDLLYFNAAPVATTAAAAQNIATNAMLNGTVNPGNLATATWFEWGTTTNYGSFTATNTLAATNVALAVSSPLTGLTLNTTYHYHAAASNALGLSYGADVSFTPSSFALVAVPGLTFQMYGGPTWGDYDNDGRLDFFNPQSDGSVQPVQPLWRNTGTTFTNSGIVLTRSIQGWGDAAAWADFDNDGKLDLIEVGSPTLVLWRNTGSGFVDVTAAMGINLGSLVPVSAAWGDFDNDGRPDFIVTGFGQPQIWRNTTNGFVNVTATLAPGLPVFQANSHVAWADFDNDGRLDFIISGWVGPTPITQFWRNRGNGFTDVTATVAPGLPGVAPTDSQGTSTYQNIAWGDYDNDGWLDLLITGTTNAAATECVTQLWHNNGGTFINVPIPGLPQGYGLAASVSWGDFDNDGRLDFFVMGTEHTGTTNVTQLWRNTGSTFTNVPIAGLPQVGYGGTAWGDFDNDGRLDFLLSGVGPLVAQVWRNLAPVINTPPTAPTGLSVVPTTNGVLLSWNAASDAQTPSAGLSYNVRAGTTPGGNDLITGNVNASTGLRRIPELGNAQMNRFFPFSLANVPLGQKIYWSVQAIDTAFAGGPFAAESVFTNGFTLVSVPGLTAGETAGWGDFDNDGLLDVLVVGNGSAKLWRNTGSTFTNVPIAGLSGLQGVAVAWGDYDNDGRLDFILTGSTDGSSSGATAQLWHNTGSGFSNVTASQLAGLPGLFQGAVAWGDFNNDGRLDLVVCGTYDDGGGDVTVSQLWRNTGSNFVNVTASVIPGLAAIYSGALAWADYDGDGRLDLLAVGAGSAQLWHNTGSNFVNVTASAAPGLPPLIFASAAWGDYDNDGRPDFLVLGATNTGPNLPVTQLWHNTGSGFTNVAIPGLPAVYNGSVQWGDYDADGRLDFAISGLNTNFAGIAQLWRNTGTGFAQAAFSGLLNQAGSFAWADYDNDGRLDFLNARVSGVQLWHNQLGATNTPPAAPTGLLMTASANAVMLSWNAATDAQTPSSGLTYNVRAGTTPGGIDLLTAHVTASSGFRRVAARGNAEQRQFLPLLGVTNGQTVYWSVQAVDNSFAGGPFATETSVVTIPTLAIVPSTSVNAIVVWTPPTFGWRLQETTNVATGPWSNAPSGELNPVTVPKTNAAKFYRLTNR